MYHVLEDDKFEQGNGGLAIAPLDRSNWQGRCCKGGNGMNMKPK